MKPRIGRPTSNDTIVLKLDLNYYRTLVTLTLFGVVSFDVEKFFLVRYIIKLTFRAHTLIANSSSEVSQQIRGVNGLSV